MRRALDQMRTVLQTWTSAAHQAGDETGAHILRTVTHLAEPRGADTAVDPYLVAERWLTVVAPALDEYRRLHHRKPYALLSDVTPTLRRRPLAVGEVSSAFADLPELTPLAERVTACILGVPGDTPTTPAPLSTPTPHASR